MNILYIFSRHNKISNFMKTCPVETNLFLADGQTWQTDMMILIDVCRNFANAPKTDDGYSVFRWTTWCYKKGSTVLIVCYLKTFRPHKIKYFVCVCMCLFLGGQCCTTDGKKSSLNDTRVIAKCQQEINLTRK